MTAATTATQSDPRRRRPTAASGQAPCAQTAIEPQLAVWPCAEPKPRQLNELSEADSSLPAPLARRAIGHYSDPGELVLVPGCGSGAALVEAVHLDRDALGLEPNRTLIAQAERALTRARADGAAGRGRVLDAGLAHLPHLLTGRGRALVPGRSDRRSATAAQLTVVPLRRSPLVDLVLAPLPPSESLAAILDGCAPLLRPGGFLVLVLGHDPAGTTRRRPLGQLVKACRTAQLRYWQHVVALDTGTYPLEAATGPSTKADGRVRRCHRDLLVLRAPSEANAASAEASAGLYETRAVA